MELPKRLEPLDWPPNKFVAPEEAPNKPPREGVDAPKAGVDAPKGLGPEVLAAAPPKRLHMEKSDFHDSNNWHIEMG